MILAVDIGNTNIGFGVFSNQPGDFKLKKSFRMITPDIATTDEMAVKLSNMLHQNEIDESEITGSIFTSVVPSLNHNITKLMNIYFNQDIINVTHSHFRDFDINYREVDDLGIDRLVNLRGAMEMAGLPCIIVDFGTATTIDVMNKNQSYLGGLIIPGIAISLDSLVANTSRLPQIELIQPQKLLGNSTKENMQNGLYYLNSMGIDHILQRVIQENFSQDENFTVVTTGGLSNFIRSPWTTPSHLIENLTLIGLKIIYDETQTTKT